MAQLLPNGKQQFADANGFPVAGGTVDFFIPGTTTRKDTWQDAAQTTLNPNPVPLDAAGRAIVYGTGDYRQVVKDALGNTIWDQVSGWALSPLAATGGAALVGFQQPDANASPLTLTSKASQGLNAEDFRYNSDGTARSDLQTLTYAIAAWVARGGGKLTLGQGRTYSLGNYTTVGITEIFPITGMRNAELDGNGAFIRLNSTAVGVRPFLFPMRDYENLVIRNLKVQDDGTNLNVNWQGVYAFCPIGDTSGKSQNGLVLDNCFVAAGVAFLFVSGTVSDVSGITILPGCNASACYYGMVFEEAGNEVVADLRTIDCMRSYFPYGVRGHKVKIFFNHGATSNGAEAMCLIKRYQQDTGDIDLTVFAKGSTANFDNIVKIEHQPNTGTTPSTFSNISITYNLSPTLDMNMSDAACDLYGQPHGSKTKPLTLSSFTMGGTEETDFTASITSGSAVVTPATRAISSFYVGQSVYGIGIPSGATVASVGTTTFTLSAAATATNATATLGATTSNVWRKIKVAGNVSMAPGDHVVARVKPAISADIAVMPGMGLNPYRCNTKGGIRFKTANGREFLTRVGDVTASPFEISLADFDNISTCVGVGIQAIGHTSGSGAQNQTRYEFNVFMQIPAGGPISIQGTPNPINNSVGTALGFGGFSVSGKSILASFTGSGYTNTDTLMVVDVTYRDQVQ